MTVSRLPLRWWPEGSAERHTSVRVRADVQGLAMANQRTNAVSVALGTGVGVVLFDLLFGNAITEAVIKGILAALIAAVLVTVVERRR